jgi:hypothetical protein
MIIKDKSIGASTDWCQGEMLTNTVKMYECSISKEPHKTENSRSSGSGVPGNPAGQVNVRGVAGQPTRHEIHQQLRGQLTGAHSRARSRICTAQTMVRRKRIQVKTAHFSVFTSAPVRVETVLIFRQYSQCRHTPKTVNTLALSVPGAGAGLPMCRPETSSRYLLSAVGVGRDSAAAEDAALLGTALEGRLCSVCMNTQSATCSKE